MGTFAKYTAALAFNASTEYLFNTEGFNDAVTSGPEGMLNSIKGFKYGSLDAWKGLPIPAFLEVQLKNIKYFVGDKENYKYFAVPGVGVAKGIANIAIHEGVSLTGSKSLTAFVDVVGGAVTQSACKAVIDKAFGNQDLFGGTINTNYKDYIVPMVFGGVCGAVNYLILQDSSDEQAIEQELGEEMLIQEVV